MRETDPSKMSNTEWERWAEARIALLEAALVDIREAMPGTDDAADRVQRIISNALQNQPNA